MHAPLITDSAAWSLSEKEIVSANWITQFSVYLPSLFLMRKEQQKGDEFLLRPWLCGVKSEGKWNVSKISRMSHSEPMDSYVSKDKYDRISIDAMFLQINK